MMSFPSEKPTGLYGSFVFRPLSHTISRLYLTLLKRSLHIIALENRTNESGSYRYHKRVVQCKLIVLLFLNSTYAPVAFPVSVRPSTYTRPSTSMPLRGPCRQTANPRKIYVIFFCKSPTQSLISQFTPGHAHHIWANSTHVLEMYWNGAHYLKHQRASPRFFLNRSHDRRFLLPYVELQRFHNPRKIVLNHRSELCLRHHLCEIARRIVLH